MKSLLYNVNYLDLIAAGCALVFLTNLVRAILVRIRTNTRKVMKVKLTVGSKTLFFDPNESTERFESQLSAALEEHSADGPTA